MSLYTFTTLEKLNEVERLIEETRAKNRAAFSDIGNRLDLLKSIAADLRGRLEGAPTVALVELDRRMTALGRVRKGGGFDTANPRALGALIGLMQEMVCRWPTVKQALEKFGQDTGEAANDCSR